MDSFSIAVIAISAGALFGAANSVFGWLKNNNVFNPREFAITVITGILAGIGLVYAEINGLIQVQDNTELLLQLGGLALSIFGVNFVRGVVSSLTASRATNQPT